MFVTIFIKILPLYILIFLGYLSGKFLKTDRNTIANFLLYVIAPIVVFSSVLNVKKEPSLIFLPLLVYAISCFMCAIVYRLSYIFFNDNLRNIIAFSSGSSNTGFFGLSVALIVLDPETVGIYILSFLGIILFENTYGFYMAAKGNFPPSYCLKRTLKLPTLHAIVLGALMKCLGGSIPVDFQEFIYNMRSTYIVLGMITIGLGLSTIEKFEIDWKCIGITLVVKYILWPVTVITLIFLDKNYFNFYDIKAHNALFILSIVPVSVSTMVVASVLNYPAEKMAVVVLLNTLTGLIYVPFIVTLLI